MILLEYQKAIEKLDLAIREDSKYADAYYRRGICHYSLDNYRQAENDFLIVTKLDMENARPYYYLGEINSERGAYDQADKYYKKIRTVSKSVAQDYGEKLIKHADDIYMKKRKVADFKDPNWGKNEDSRKAIKLVEKAILIDPDTPDYLFILANYQTDMHEFSDAITTYKKMLTMESMEGQQSELYINIAKVYDRKKEVTASDEYFQKALSLEPLQSNALITYFIPQLQDILPEDQLAFIERFNRLLPNEYYSKLLFGMYYADHKDYANAIKYYNEAIEINSDYTDSYRGRANAYYGYAYEQNELSYIHKAVEDWDKVIDKGGKTEDSYYARGLAKQILLEQDYLINKKADVKMAQAVLKDIEAVLALDDRHAHAYKLRASVNYYLNGEKETADVLEDMGLHDKYCLGKH